MAVQYLRPFSGLICDAILLNSIKVTSNMNPLYLLSFLVCFYDQTCSSDSSRATNHGHQVGTSRENNPLTDLQNTPPTEIFKLLISTVDIRDQMNPQPDIFHDNPINYQLAGTEHVWNVVGHISNSLPISTFLSTKLQLNHNAPTTSPPLTIFKSQKRQDSPFIFDQNCVFLGAALGRCESLTPGFTAAMPASQADCLCYSSLIWVPNVFDKAVDGCARFASTAVPVAYGALVALGQFCGKLGNWKTSTAGMHSTTSGTALSATSITTMPGLTPVLTHSMAFNVTETMTFQTSSMVSSTDESSLTAYKSPYTTTKITISTTPVINFTSFEDLTISSTIPSSTSFSTTIITRLKSASTTALTSIHSSQTPTTYTRYAPPTSSAVTVTPVPTNGITKAKRMIGEWEIVWVSFCCAVVMLFL
jgi:hypothetical protein